MGALIFARRSARGLATADLSEFGGDEGSGAGGRAAQETSLKEHGRRAGGRRSTPADVKSRLGPPETVHQLYGLRLLEIK
jgi:hypothetical protein